MNDIYNNDFNESNHKTNLSSNHIIVLKVFDEFNKLLNNEFDCYYTGGLMLFIGNNDKLERYHNDLDLFINEQQLLELFNRVNDTSKFRFESNMRKKGINGHEYKIIYDNLPISIGLFLFQRKADGGIITKKYYYDDLSKRDQLCVDERHFCPMYTKLVFKDNVLNYHDSSYKMVSPEYILYSKLYLKPKRQKDYYDIKYASDKVDINLIKKIDNEKQKKKDINHILVNDSIIYEIEELLSSNTKLK